MYIKSSESIPFQAMPECNAYEVLWNRHEQAECPDDLIIHIEGASGKKSTYQEFRTRVILGATALDRSLSAENTEMIAIISHSSSDCAALVHSLLLLATPFVLFDPCWTPSKFEYALKLIKPTRLFVQDQLVPTFIPLAESIAVENIYVLGQKSEGFRTFEEMLEDTRSREMASVSPRPATLDTLAYLMFSSGTTGPPKAVMISHGNIIANINKGRNRRALGGNSIGSQGHKIPICLIHTSICHVSGLHYCCLSPFIAPVTSVIVIEPSFEYILETIARYQVTVAHFQPFFIQQLLRYSRLKDVDLSTLQLVTTSGLYFSPALLAKMAVAIPHKFEFGQVYGMTESFAITTIRHQPIVSGETDCHVANSVGKLHPIAEAKLLREDGSDAGVNEPGELYVRSQTVALGYWNDEKTTRETFFDGWLRTGDIFRVDQSGNFFIVGRVKDTFKTPAGCLVFPLQIEDALSSEPQGLISDVVVAGVTPSPRSKDERGKVPRAWIVLSDEGKKLGVEAVIKELEVWYQKTFGDHVGLHGGIEIVDEIPKTKFGKPLRAELQKNYEERMSERARTEY